ncbi:hypothetical protein Tco_1073377, partial [Tanacetum coccineum]
AQVARRNERIQVREEDIKRLGEEVESLMVVEIKVHGLRNQTKNLETLLEAEVTGEEIIKAIFEEFKKYEDDKVEKRCAEIDARLDALSIDFDEELYPHILTAIVGRRWVIRHDLRLALMKCAESIDVLGRLANVHVGGGSPMGLAILLADAATQTDISEDEASSKLLKSKSLPPMLAPVPLLRTVPSVDLNLYAPFPSQRESGAAMAWLNHCTMGPEEIGEFFDPVLVSLAQAGLDSFPQASVYSFYESIGLRVLY